jgi:hypothetical protein
MEDSLIPLENQNPLNNTNPMEDPLLDALEHSIVNPLGFTDPLVVNENPLMDDLAIQLDAIEAGIENSPPIPPNPHQVNLREKREKMKQMHHSKSLQFHCRLPPRIATNHLRIWAKRNLKPVTSKLRANRNNLADGPGLVQRPDLRECHMVTIGVKEAIRPCIDQDRVGALGLKETAGLHTVLIPMILSTKKNVIPARNSVTGPKARTKNLESAGMIGKQNR